MNAFYPEPITSPPETDIPFEGVRGWLLQGPDHQVVFQGEGYFIPAGAEHAAVFRKLTWLMDCPPDREGYKTK